MGGRGRREDGGFGLGDTVLKSLVGSSNVYWELKSLIWSLGCGKGGPGLKTHLGGQAHRW